MNNLSIAAKAGILLGLMLTTLLLTIGISWSMISDAIVHERRAMLVDIVEMARGIIEKEYQAQQRGEKTEAEAQRVAIESLRPFRYGENGYVFIYQGGVAKLAPENPGNEGKDFIDVKDANGLYIGREMSRITANNGSGFLSYHWFSPGEPDHPAEKLSYAHGFEPWGWYVGTGIYQNDIQHILFGLLKRKSVLLLLAALAMAGFLLAGFVITRALIKRLLRVKTELQHLSEGNLTRALVSDGRDEIGQMMTYVRQLQQRIREVAQKIIMTSDSLLGSTANAAVDNERLKTRSLRQASEMERIDTALKNIATTTRDNDAAIQAATDRASRTLDTVAKCDTAINAAIASMERINDSSAQVGEIISVIDDLAFQTNLLALNAAVEAARAGDSGKGFAVVANEVRNLAQRSAEAARQIRDLIEDSSANVSEGSQRVNESGKLLEAFFDDYDRINRLLTEIAASATQQSQEIRRCSEAVDEHANMARQNLGCVERNADVSGRLQTLAAAMRQQLAFFQLGEQSIKPEQSASEAAQRLPETKSKEAA